MLLLACGVTTGESGGGSGGGLHDPVSFVDPVNGRDTNNGYTQGSAFRTLGRAAKALQPGWTVKLMNGTHTTDGGQEPLVIDVSGTADAFVTVTAAEGHHPVIQVPPGPNGWSGIHLLGASYVVVDGIEIVGRAASITYDEAATKNDGTQSLYNHNGIYVDGVGYPGTRPKVPHDIVIRNTIVHDCTAAGIQVTAADAVTIERNQVYRNSWWTRFGTSGIGFFHLTDAPGATTKNGYRNFIVRNISWGNRNELPFGRPGVPSAIYDGNGIIIDDSKHTQPALGANDIQGAPYSGRTYVANNIVHDNGGRGIHVYSSVHVDVVNNTTWNDLLSTSDFLKWGEVDGFSSSDVQFVNNIAVNRVGKDVALNDGNRYDFNLWDGASAPYKGPNDLWAPAKLADPGTGDFAPAAGSPALKSGTSALAPADDFFGNPRLAGAIDRGAVQVSR